MQLQNVRTVFTVVQLERPSAVSQSRQGLIVRLGKFILPKDGGYMQEMRSSRRSLCMRGIGERGNKDRSPP